MSFIQIANFLLIMTVIVQVMRAQGETFIPSANNKNQGIKTTDKRLDHFRVPVEQTFDPNFWPARGRRGRVDTENQSQNANCVSDENLFDKDSFHCTDGSYGPGDASSQKSNIFGVANMGFDSLTGLHNGFPEIKRRVLGDCYNILRMLLQSQRFKECRDILGSKFVSNTLDTMKHKKLYDVPAYLWYYDGDVFWKPDNSRNVEKEKKHDVFWVARGKRNAFK